MKIGILTFHRAINYGGVLQCYALVTYLRMLGYDAEVVDYRSKAIEDNYRLIKTGNLHDFLYTLSILKLRYLSKRNFRHFTSRYCKISDKSYFSSSDIADEYDVLIIGSDQVWSKRINKGFDEVYWGQIPGKQKIISYAASMGTDHCYTEDEYKLLSSYMERFDAISVRENILREELLPYTQKDITVVLDPTLLLSILDYEKIAKKPQQEKYIFYYQIQYNKCAKDRVIEIASELGCSIVVLGGKKERYRKGDVYIDKSMVSIPEFIGYIMNADCVFASSFHGTALSIVMKKNFYFLANGRNERSANILRLLQIEERMIAPEKELFFSAVDYNKVDILLDKLRLSSREFLNKNLK